MNSHEISPNGSGPAESEQEVKETVPPTMRVVGDTEGVTDQNSKKSVTDDLSSTGVATTWKQPKRMNPDSGLFIRVVVTGVIVAGLVAFAISFVALYSVAEWLGLPPWMWWAVPVFIDLAIVVYAGLVLVHKSRGEGTWPSWVALGSFTLLSVIANGAHALSHQHDTQWQAWIGVLIAAMVPIAIFVATEQLSRVAIEDLASRKSEIEDQIELEAFEATQRQTREQLAFEQEQRQWERETQRLRAMRETEIEQRHHELELSEVHTNSSTPGNGRQESVGHHSEVAASPASPTRPAPSDDALVTFIREQVAEGHEITGTLVGDYLGVSDRTGRRRVKDLQTQFPDLLAAPDAVNTSELQLQVQT